MQIYKGHVEIGKKNQSTLAGFSFAARNGQKLEKDYKIIVVHKIWINNITKIQTIPSRNEGVSVFKKSLQ